MGGHVGEGLRTVLLDPGDGLSLHDDDVLSLAVDRLERVVVVVFVIVVVYVHERYYLGHDDRWCWTVGGSASRLASLAVFSTLFKCEGVSAIQRGFWARKSYGAKDFILRPVRLSHTVRDVTVRIGFC